MARKREERAIRAAHKKQRQAQNYMQDDLNFVSFKNQLNALGLEIKDIPGDGNCLFRALADQLDGHSKDHHTHRLAVVDYMLQHSTDFAPFVEDDVPFERHIKNLRKPGTYAGNDVIVAFARLHDVTVVIHQMNSPVWQVHGGDSPSARQLHISYHNGDHYSSVRKIGDTSSLPTNICLQDCTNAAANGKVNEKKKPYSQHETYEDAYTWHDNPDDVMDFGYDNEYSDDTMTERVTHSDADGVARATRTADDYVECVMRETGCQDARLVEEILQEEQYDLDAAVTHILHFMPCGQIDTAESDAAGSSLWGEGGTGSRLFGGEAASTGTKPKHKKQSAKETAKQKKQEKQARAMERHKQRLRNGTGSEIDAAVGQHEHACADEHTLVVQNMASLVI